MKAGTATAGPCHNTQPPTHSQTQARLPRTQQRQQPSPPSLPCQVYIDINMLTVLVCNIALGARALLATGGALPDAPALREELGAALAGIAQQ